MNRRDFLRRSMAATLPLVAYGSIDDVAFAATGSETVRNGMIYRVLGSTGERVSLLGLGGFHIGGQKDERESIAIIRAAIDHGVNFMDNCWDYHGGVSEVRMGKALRDGYRAKAFLMTKIDGRTKKAAAKQLEESLGRLQTDHVDLLQFHEIIHMNDPDRIFAPGGGVEAVVEARKAGKVRYVGFTGHKDPAIHLHMLDVAKAHGFRFDAVQMPLNVMDAHFHSFQKRILPRLQAEKIGVLGMKSMGDGFILKSGTATPAECLQYAMSLPTSVVISGMENMEFLDKNLAVVRAFKPMSADAIRTLLARTAPKAADGAYEPFKTTVSFDGTTANPQWMG